ncbi:hypothetical protein BDW59DRAFT_141714 [Aspergillus cavernicola]|uniref:Uncharacterized protein n=1 Tax=Aspergillus cavernicola TaxID=176166 RepID=A0ABR4IS42_9EURO
MQSSKANPTNPENPVRKAAAGVTESARSMMPGSLKTEKEPKDPKDPKDSTTGWSIEEMLETGLDKNGNPVPDAISYIDGARMAKGERGFDDQGDVVSAALDDFD